MTGGLGYEDALALAGSDVIAGRVMRPRRQYRRVCGRTAHEPRLPLSFTVRQCQRCGRGFTETYRDLRLRHARRLLQQSPLLVSEIAVATGFSSAGHFATAYRRAFGHTLRQERD